MKGCKNSGYKSARIIDEAVLGVVAAELFSEGFVAAVTKDVNAILAAAAKRPAGSTRKLEQEIANRERQIARLTARLDKVSDAGGLDAIFDKVAEMERELKAKRAELAEQQRLNRRPPVKRVKEKDVTAALAQLRQLLQSDVGLAAPVLKELVGSYMSTFGQCSERGHDGIARSGSRSGGLPQPTTPHHPPAATGEPNKDHGIR